MCRETMNRVLASALLLVLLISGLLTACKSTAEPTPEPDQVILQLNWTHEAEFSGYYVAEAKGFYAEENLNVTIQAGGFAADGMVDVPQVLANREADFAVVLNNEYQKAVDLQSQPVALAATLQMPVMVVFSLSDSGIQKPPDMVGRRVAIKNEVWRSAIHDLLSNTGVDPAEIIEVEVEYDDMEMLYNGEVDVWTGYVHDEPNEAQLAGYDLNLIFMGDYGVGVYNGLLVTRQDMLDENSDVVARFVKASLRGWQYAIEHPDETGEIVAQWDPDKSVEFHQAAVRALIPLIDVGTVPIGWIEAERWQIARGADYDSERSEYTIEFVQAAQPE